MAIPSNVLENFERACYSLPILDNLYLNIDHTMTASEFYESKPFKALHIRYTFKNFSIKDFISYI